MRHSARLFMVTLLTLSCSASYAGLTDQPLLSIGLTVGDGDNDRAAASVDHGAGFGFKLGLDKKVHSRLLIGVQSSFLEYDDQAGSELTQINAGIDLAVLLRKSGNLIPYAVAGVGHQRSDDKPNNQKAQNSYADIGLGFFHKLNEYGILFKADARLRRDFFDDATSGTTNYNDAIFNIGITIPLGEKQDEPQYESAQQQFNDEDNDGIADSRDECPNTYANATVDINGCSNRQNSPVQHAPVPAPAPTQETAINQHSQYAVAFEAGSSNLTHAGANTLNDIVRTLRHRRELIADISGGAPSGGSSQLATQRAENMRKWLYKQGVSDDRVLINTHAVAKGSSLNSMVKLRAN